MQPIVEGAGQHVVLRCKNHPDLRWMTKNIDYIGARSIFYKGSKDNDSIVPDIEECNCPLRDLEVLPN